MSARETAKPVPAGNTAGLAVLKSVAKLMDGGSSMADKDHEDEHHGPLSPYEIRRIRRLVKDSDYSIRFWKNFRLWAGWVSASIIFVLTFWDKVKAYVPINYLPWGP